MHTFTTTTIEITEYDELWTVTELTGRPYPDDRDNLYVARSRESAERFVAHHASPDHQYGKCQWRCYNQEW